MITKYQKIVYLKYKVYFHISLPFETISWITLFILYVIFMNFVYILLGSPIVHVYIEHYFSWS